ncbi:MAG TPA: ABC transporter permease, partial [Thermoanaerobaculia bacterium]
LMVATAILDNIFAPRAPETRLDRTLGIYTLGMYGKESSRTGTPGYKFLDRYMRNLPGAEATSIFSQFASVSMFVDGRKLDAYIRRTDGEYWRILQFKFLEGAPFTQADDDAGRMVAVINETTREKVFGKQPAVGKMIDVDGQRFRVVGVVSDVAITRMAAFSEIWVPVRTAKSADYRQQTWGDFGGIVLAKSKDDIPRLKREFDARISAYVFDDPMFDRISAGLGTTFESFARTLINGQDSDLVRRGPWIIRGIMLTVALLFITLPTMNLVSINLSRIMERSSEIGVRRAFGASSRTLVGQFVTENVVLTAIGGLIGFVIAMVALYALNTIEFIPYEQFDLNLRIFGYAMLIALAFGVISGVYPAWRMARLDPVNALRGGAV